MLPSPLLAAFAEFSADALAAHTFSHDEAAYQGVGFRLQVSLYRYFDPADDLILESCNECSLILCVPEIFDPSAHCGCRACVAKLEGQVGSGLGVFGFDGADQNFCR